MIVLRGWWDWVVYSVFWILNVVNLIVFDIILVFCFLLFNKLGKIIINKIVVVVV